MTDLYTFPDLRDAKYQQAKWIAYFNSQVHVVSNSSIYNIKYFFFIANFLGGGGDIARVRPVPT